jgi:hypothetical protein
MSERVLWLGSRVTMSAVEQENRQQTFEARCPSCNQLTVFRFLGEQRWPLEVARITGLAPINYLYVCGHCHSTVSKASLDS